MPRFRFRDVCPINDECPAIERSRPGWLAVRGNLRDGTGEETVEIPDSLLPEVADLEVENLGAFISARHHTDLLRIQTLSRYSVASDGEDFRRYMENAEAPAGPAREAWFDKLRSDAVKGKIRRNVHVVREPLTDYLRYAFEWGYAFNAAAGQKIRILVVDDTPAAVWLAKVGDFNVIEGIDVVRNRYDDDGFYLGAVQVGADGAESYAALAELAWELAVPFESWWASHPQYHRDVRAA